MLFSSMIFLWVFLPLVIIIYYLINFIIKDKKTCTHVKNIFLLIASLVFYAWGGIYFLGIMIASIILNFFGGFFISKVPSEKKTARSIVLFIVIVLNLAMLFYFKYFNMLVIAIEQVMAHPKDFITCITNIFNMERTGALNVKEVVLPIGISFFTFQAMSYVIDVYRSDADVQKNIFDFGLYVALFPQLIAGPIVKYSDIAREINDRTENADKFAKGIKRFCYGMGKKVIIANTLAIAVDSIWALELEKIGAPIAILAMFSYTFQIYYDFSGYSDMAIGLGLMFGFDFKENFNYPFLSLSVTEFWRKWHISLSTWFKEYVYIPLGGNRCGLFRTCVNILIVFFLTGVWHGANWTFILWGLSYGILLVIEKVFLLKLLNKNKIKFINWIYSFMIFNLLFILFRANTIYDAGEFYRQFMNFESKYNILTYISLKYIIVFIAAILCMGVLQKIFGKLFEKVKYNLAFNVLDFVLQMSILVYSIFSVVDGTYNPFIYFQF